MNENPYFVPAPRRDADEQPLVKVRYAKGRTINLGNFNSVRVDVEHEAWCPPHRADETFEKVRAFVERRLAKETEGA